LLGWWIVPAEQPPYQPQRWQRSENTLRKSQVGENDTSAPAAQISSNTTPSNSKAARQVRKNVADLAFAP
jgi:hypothetical protein